ncbi:GNAT family N-acetyltransferase [Halobacteriales archaeon Cl-PHB]
MTGDTVSLHPVEPEDYDFIQRGRNHPSTRIPLLDTTIRTRADVEDLFEADSEYHFLVCTPGEGDADPTRVGVVAFAYTSGTDRGSLMYWLAPEARGNGYMPPAVELMLDYAFREVGFHKVTARAIATNDPSIATLESLGFEREGHFRKHKFVDGEWTDSYQYGLLADAWLAD